MEKEHPRKVSTSLASNHFSAIYLTYLYNILKKEKEADVLADYLKKIRRWIWEKRGEKAKNNEKKSSDENLFKSNTFAKTFR